MKVILAILIWVIIALVIILGVKTIIRKIQELKETSQELIEAKRLLKNWLKEFNCKLSFNERAELVKSTEAFKNK